ncbi:MAG: FkbM family methyltransferase [Cytophagaceae bacterium]
MDKNQLLLDLQKIQSIAAASKWTRLFHNPFRYINAIGFRLFIYPFTHKEKRLGSKVFWGKEMLITLPSATDIYLLKGKTHTSEIRLVRFLINNLSNSSTFLDIGAHYGYYSMLVAELTQGNIRCIEASNDSYDVLLENIKDNPSTKATHCAVSDINEDITFYEFDSQYSEYSATDVSQFENEDWYKNHPPKKIVIPGTTIDHFLYSNSFFPEFIKMDVEGAEFKAIKGGQKFFQEYSPVLVMEYLAPERQNTAHQNAVELLRSWGYQSYSIQNDGTLKPESNLDDYLKRADLDSDNIVLKK